MSLSIILVCILNFLITLIGTLAYSVRIVGIRTGKIAVSSALFNAIALVSRTAYAFQLPILTKFVDKSENTGNLIFIFNTILGVICVASIAGAFLLPTFQRVFVKAVDSFSLEKSFFKLVMHSFSKSGVKYLKNSVAIPTKNNFKGISLKRMPKKILLFNAIIVALLTAGIFSPIYAGVLEPELSATCMTLSAVITGLAAILSALFVDPYLSVVTDEVIDGKYSEADFRGCIIGMVGSKIIGSVLSFAVFIPASYAIAFIARVI